jgi:hypothetical protein
MIVLEVSVLHTQAAAPVGKWVVQQGFKAAFGGFSQNAQRGKQRKASRRDEQDEKGDIE